MEAKRETASKLDDEARRLLTDASERYWRINQENRAADEAAATLVSKLAGLHVVKNGKRYEVTTIEAGYMGLMNARGYRITANGKRGTQVWDIGAVSSTDFDRAAQ